jgi:hypothetical protein
VRVGGPGTTWTNTTDLVAQRPIFDCEAGSGPLARRSLAPAARPAARSRLSVADEPSWQAACADHRLVFDRSLTPKTLPVALFYGVINFATVLGAIVSEPALHTNAHVRAAKTTVAM